MLGVHSDSVDDFSQEAFLIAYRELDRFDQDQDFGKWLRGIARNLVRNELRRNARRGRLMDEEVTTHLLAVTDSDCSDMEFEEAARIRDQIGKLEEEL